MINRKVLKTETYNGRTITATYCGPDILANVNGEELQNFYLNIEAAIAAGRRYVDDQMKEAKRRQEAERQNKKTR